MSAIVDRPAENDAAAAAKPPGLRPSRLQWFVLLTVLGASGIAAQKGS